MIAKISVWLVGHTHIDDTHIRLCAVYVGADSHQWNWFTSRQKHADTNKTKTKTKSKRNVHTDDLECSQCAHYFFLSFCFFYMYILQYKCKSEIRETVTAQAYVIIKCVWHCIELKTKAICCRFGGDVVVAFNCVVGAEAQRNVPDFGWLNSTHVCAHIYCRLATRVCVYSNWNIRLWLSSSGRGGGRSSYSTISSDMGLRTEQDRDDTCHQ